MRGNLLAIIFLALSALGFFGFVKGHYENIKVLRMEKSAYDKALSEAAEVDKIRSILVSKYTSIPKDSLARLEKLLPDSVDSIRLVLDINNIAEQSNVAVADIGVSSSVEGGQVGKSGSIVSGRNKNQAVPYDLSVVVSGKYDDFKTFLENLEKSLRVLDVTNISFQRADDAGPLNYTLKIKTYWLKK